MKIMKLSNLALATKILLQVVFVHVIARKAKMIAVKDLASKAAFKRWQKKRQRQAKKEVNILCHISSILSRKFEYLIMSNVQ